MQKCSCGNIPIASCAWPEPTSRNPENTCGLALCVKCASGPEANLCRCHWRTRQEYEYMDTLMALALANGHGVDGLEIYGRENFFRWKQFFAERTPAEVAYKEDLELQRLIAETSSEFYENRTRENK